MPVWLAFDRLTESASACSATSWLRGSKPCTLHSQHSAANGAYCGSTTCLYVHSECTLQSKCTKFKLSRILGASVWLTVCEERALEIVASGRLEPNSLLMDYIRALSCANRGSHRGCYTGLHRAAQDWLPSGPLQRECTHRESNLPELFVMLS